MAELKTRKQGSESSGSSKYVDPIETVSDKIVEHLNFAHGATMLLLAWHFGQRPDTMLGQMIQVDRLVFLSCIHILSTFIHADHFNATSLFKYDYKLLVNVLHCAHLVIMRLVCVLSVAFLFLFHLRW
jgi:hypothetical protein